MKKSLLFMGLAAVAFASCSLAVDDDAASSAADRASKSKSSKKTSATVELSHPVIDGTETGPFGDISFKEIVSYAESSGIIDVNSNGKVYYISPDGNDKNDGTSEKPFKTFKTALSKLKAGDTLYVKTGSKISGTKYRYEAKYKGSGEEDIEVKQKKESGTADFNEQIQLKNLNGNEDNYITIASDPRNTESPVLSRLNASSGFAILTIKNSSYVRISGLHFSSSHGKNAGGIVVQGSSNNVHHVIVDNCEFSYIATPDPAEEDNTANGILLLGQAPKYSINNILIFNNKFHDMATGWSECISAPGNVENLNVIANDLNETGNIGIDVGGNYKYCSDASKDFTRYAYIANNTVRNEMSAYGDTAYGIYADGGQHIVIVNNVVEDCMGGFEVGAEEVPSSEKYSTNDVLIRGNKVSNNTSDKYKCKHVYTLQIGGYEKERGWVKNVKIVDNDISASCKTENPLIVFSKCDGITVEGNDFSASSKFKGCVFGYDFGKSSSKTKNVKIGENEYSSGLSKYDD